MARSLIVLTAFLFSLYFTSSEAPEARAVKANSFSQSAFSVESIYTAPQQTEKHFLPAEEIQLVFVRGAFASVSLFSLALPAETSDLNNRGPPTVRI